MRELALLRGVLYYCCAIVRWVISFIKCSACDEQGEQGEQQIVNHMDYNLVSMYIVSNKLNRMINF